MIPWAHVPHSPFFHRPVPFGRGHHPGFMTRWSLEGNFEESRAHLGIETQRQWSDLVSERASPLLFGLSRVVARFGYALDPDRCLPVAHAAWSRTQAAPLHDVLAAVRRHLWGHETFSTSPTDPDVVFVPRAPLQRWSLAVCSCIGQGQIAMSIRAFTGICGLPRISPYTTSTWVCASHAAKSQEGPPLAKACAFRPCPMR